MAGWIDTVDPSRVQRQALGVRGRNLALLPVAGAPPLLLAPEERALLARWLRRRHARVRWQTLLGECGRDVALGERLLRRLLEAGGCRVELHPAGSGHLMHQLEPYWVEWLDAYALREHCGLPPLAHGEEMVELWRAWQPVNPVLQPLSAALQPGVQAATLERRLKLAQALDAWLSAERWGTERQFSQYALGRSKAFSAGDRDWFASLGVDLAACGVSRHTPHVFMAGPLALFDGDDCLVSRRLLSGGVALNPVLLTEVRRIDGDIAAVRVVENLSVFEVLCRDGGPYLTVWVPGRPHVRWRRALAHLLGLLRRPVQVACDLDPAGIAIALEVGALAHAAGCPWQPWQMQVDTIALQQSEWLLGAHDQAELARLSAQPLPPMLRQLAQQLQATGRKLEQEILFLARD